MLVQNEAHLGGGGGGAPAAPPSSGHEHILLRLLGDSPIGLFWGEGPLDADDWLCTTVSKFSLLHCTEFQKMLYATQQLRGPARA
jgi:hypothetical protein